MPPTKKTKDGSAAHVDRLQSFVFKKYPGDQQAQLRVKIEVPGKWFGAGEAGALSAGERREKYDAVACEYEEKHVFEAAQARKPAKVGEAIRFLCHADAADDADSSGYWMPLDIWNRYRNTHVNMTVKTGSVSLPSRVNLWVFFKCHSRRF